MSDAPAFPAVRRAVTGHTPDGKAVFLDISTLDSRPFEGFKTRFVNLFRSVGKVATNSVEFVDDARLKPQAIMPGTCPENPDEETSSTLWACEMPPHSSAVSNAATRARN